MARVIVVGSANQDLRIEQTHTTRPGETLLARSARFEVGGKGLNQAVAARRAGAEVAFIGAVGQDAAGDGVAALLGNEGIDTAGLRRVSDPTGLAVVTVTDDGENSIVVVPGANAAAAPDFAVAALHGVSSGDIVLLQQEIPIETVREAARSARAAGATVVLNAAPSHPETPTLLSMIDTLVVNDTELHDVLEKLADDSDRSRSAERIAREYAMTVVCTRGAAGADLYHQDTTTHFGARAADVRDTTAAGDTFVGYLCAVLALGGDRHTAMTRATAAAGITVSRHGSARSIPRADEVPDQG